jgi:hypothetical protein
MPYADGMHDGFIDELVSSTNGFSIGSMPVFSFITPDSRYEPVPNCPGTTIGGYRRVCAGANVFATMRI